MESHQFGCRITFEAEGDLDLEAFVPVFHAWIREHALEDEVMIDVADYAHVVDGPGVLLVCHEGHYVIERRGGVWALVYNRKRGGVGDAFADRVRVPLRRLARAATLLASDPTLGKLRFRTDELVLRVYDRLHAPNTDETLAGVRDGLEQVLGSVYGGAVRLDREGQEREVFTVRVRGSSSPGLEAFAG